MNVGNVSAGNLPKGINYADGTYNNINGNMETFSLFDSNNNLLVNEKFDVDGNLTTRKSFFYNNDGTQ